MERKDEPRCCETRPEGTDKYYSIPNKRNCGESCIAPADYDKYHRLEPGLIMADSNTPCADNDYPVYDHRRSREAHRRGDCRGLLPQGVVVFFRSKPISQSFLFPAEWKKSRYMYNAYHFILKDKTKQKNPHLEPIYGLILAS